MKKATNYIKLYISIFLFLIVSTIYGQDIKQVYSWFEVNQGKYELKSTSKLFHTTNIIKPQLLIYSIKENISYIVPKYEAITLFKNNHPKSKEDVSGKLTSNSLIEVLEIDYRQTFQDPDTVWKYTHEVWYKIKINEQIYFTDYQIHDLDTIRHLNKLDQIIAIASQNTGYDNYYDNGYPEFFHFLVFIKMKDQRLLLQYESQELDFKCNCEYWEAESETSEWRELENGYLLIKLYGLEQSYSATWNGEELTEE